VAVVLGRELPPLSCATSPDFGCHQCAPPCEANNDGCYFETEISCRGKLKSQAPLAVVMLASGYSLASQIPNSTGLPTAKMGTWRVRTKNDEFFAKLNSRAFEKLIFPSI
jgi:hypothetical protein